MKQLLLIGAAALVVASLVPDQASAQRGRVGIGGVRAAGIPSGVGIARGGYAIRGGAWRGGWAGWRGRGLGWGFPVAAGLAAAGAYAYYGGYPAYGYSGYPAYGYSNYGYSDQCTAWNGYQWVSICRPYDWNYGNNSMW